MKRVLYIVSTLRKVGPINQLSYIVRSLDRAKFQPIVLTLSPEPSDSMIKYFREELGVRVESLSLTRVQSIFLAKKKLYDFVIRNNIDIIHSQGLRADLFASKLRILIPKITTIRNYPQLDFSMTYGKLLGYIMTRVQIYVLQYFDVCCGVSYAVSNNLSKKFGLKNVVTVRNGVDREKFYPLNCEDKTILRKHLLLPLNKKIWVSFIGKDQRKDAKSVAMAYKKLYKEDDGNFLIFIGTGSLKVVCENILNDIDDVLFTGEMDNVVQYLQVADYMISASYAEGLPNAVLEALACGLPVVLSDIEPHREIFSLNDKIGLLFLKGSFDNLYEKMKELILRNYDEVRHEVLDVVKRELGSSKMSKKYQEIYQALGDSKR